METEKTELQLHCTLHCFYSHPVVAFFYARNLGSTMIGFHDHFVSYVNVDKGQFMSLRFVLLECGFLYKILSTSVNHDEVSRDSLQHLTQNPAVTIKTQNNSKRGALRFSVLANFWLGFFVCRFWCLARFVGFLQISLWISIFVNNDWRVSDFSIQCILFFFPGFAK